MACIVAVATPRLAADKAEAPAALGDQRWQVEHRPPLARCAVRGELVVVFVKRAERVERDHVRNVARVVSAPARNGN